MPQSPPTVAVDGHACRPELTRVMPPSLVAVTSPWSTIENASVPEVGAVTVRFFVSGGEAKKLGVAVGRNIWQKFPFEAGQALPWMVRSQAPGALPPLRIAARAAAPPLVPRPGPTKSLWKR